MSRKYDKMPRYFQIFLDHHKLWPRFWDKDESMKGITISSIEHDVGGHTIKRWQYIVNNFLEQYGAHLIYIRATGKQHLIFDNEQAKEYFIINMGLGIHE